MATNAHPSHALPWWKQSPFWGAFGTTLTLAVAGLTVRDHIEVTRCLLLAAYPFAVLALWFALSGVETKLVRRWVTLLFGIVLAATVYRILPTTFDVYPLFRTKFEELRYRLDDPVSPAIHGRTAYIANCDKGVVIWLEQDSVFYGVPNDQSTPVTIVGDPMWDSYEAWIDSTVVRRKFKDIGMDIPKDHIPPYLGFASHYYKEIERWKGIGWPTWDCALETARIYSHGF